MPFATPVSLGMSATKKMSNNMLWTLLISDIETKLSFWHDSRYREVLFYSSMSYGLMPFEMIPYRLSAYICHLSKLTQLSDDKMHARLNTGLVTHLLPRYKPLLVVSFNLGWSTFREMEVVGATLNAWYWCSIHISRDVDRKKNLTIWQSATERNS